MSLGPPTKPPTPDPVANELMEKHRLSVIGSLAGKIAHHMNNPLTLIRANVSDLSRAMESAPDIESLRLEQRVVLEEIQDGVQDLLRYVEAVATFTQTDGEFESLDLDGLVDTALAVAFSKVRYGVDIKFDRPDTPMRVRGCAQQLVQLIVSVLLHIDARPSEFGSCTISIHRLDGDALLRIADRRPSGLIAHVPDGSHHAEFDPELGLILAHHVALAHDTRLRLTELDDGMTVYEVALDRA
jgi:signal transduction histidine kinase